MCRSTLAMLTAALVMAITACSDDGAASGPTATAVAAGSTPASTASGASTTAGVTPAPLRCSPALSASLDGTDGKPLVCGAARFLSGEEEVDKSGDYVLLTVSWSLPDNEKLAVAVGSSAPTLDGVLVTGELANAEEVTQCSAQPNAGKSALFETTAASGRCMVRQKVAQGTSDVDLSLDMTRADNTHVTASVHATAAK